MKNIAIVMNGVLFEDFIREIKAHEVIIGVDRAAYWLIQHGVIPSVAIGDFDSVNKEELKVIRKKVPMVQSFPSEKDFTDTELALRYALRQKPKSIVMYGGSGTRLDHVLGTIHLLERCLRLGIFTVFRDRTNEIVVIGRGRTILKKRAGYRYVSLVPITQSIQVTLSNFKYEIKNTIIRRGQTIGISNEFIGGQGEITLSHGRALVIQSRD